MKYRLRVLQRKIDLVVKVDFNGELSKSGD